MKSYYLVLTTTREPYGVAHHDAYCHSLELAQSYLRDQTYPCVSREIFEIDVEHCWSSFKDQLERAASQNRPLHKNHYTLKYTDISGVKRIRTIHEDAA